MRITTCFGDRTISGIKIFIIVSVSRTDNLMNVFNSILLPLRFLHYFFIMPVGFNLNVTNGLKPQVSSIKMVTAYRQSISQL